MSATLSAHAGGYKCDLKTVRAVESPEFTDTWHPINHGDLIDIVQDRMKDLKYVVDSSEYALARDGKQMFATYNLRMDDRKDFTLALGLRNSIDKSLSAGLCCGSRVFVCDNLAFSSDIVFMQRHTSMIQTIMPGLVDSALKRFSDDGKKQETLFNRMKKIEVPLETAIDVIVDLGEEKKFLPSPQLHKVIKEFVKPRFQEFEGRSVWSLLNACTTFCRHDRREIDPGRNQQNLLGIHQTITERFALSEN